MIVSHKKILYLFYSTIVLFLILSPIRQWFLVQNIYWLYILILTFIMANFFTPAIRSISTNFQILDIPNVRKIHFTPTPLLGGLAVYIAFLSVISYNLYFPDELKAIVIAATLILIVGVFDDIRGLSSRFRLITQGAATFILIKMGIMLTVFPNTKLGLILNAFITFLWIVGITNAFNFIDGMDGLAVGIGAISALFLGIVALQTNQYLLMLLSFTLMGGCLGFLPFNFKRNKPATIFLGDTGATFIGFMLASLAIMGEWDVRGSIKTYSMPLLIFSLLIFDTMYIFIARISTKKVTTLKEMVQ